MNNIIAVEFRKETYSRNVLGLRQWDKEIWLQISGLATEYDVQVHFSLHDDVGSARNVEATVTDGKINVKIPAFILEGEGMSGVQYCGYAFVYITDGEFGKTIRKIRLFVTKRPKPENYGYSEADLKEWEKIKERLDQLEQNGISEEKLKEAIEKHLNENTIQTGATEEEAKQIWQNRDDIVTIKQDIGDAEILLGAI